MPAEKGNHQAVTIWLEKQVVSRLTVFAELAEISRSKIVEKIIETQLKTILAFEKIGLVQFLLIINYLIKKIVYKKAQGGQAKESQSMSIWLKKDVVSEVDRLAQKVGNTRSKILRNLVNMGVDELENVQKFGQLHHSEIMKDMEKKLSKKYEMVIKKEGLQINQ